MIGRNCGDAHHRATDGSVDKLCELKHFICRTRRNKSATVINERSFAVVYAFSRRFDSFVICRLLFIGKNGCLGFIFARCNLNVLGNVNENGSRSARLCNHKCFTDCVCKFINGTYEIIMFCYGESNSRYIYFLKTVRTDVGARHVARYCNKRNGIYICRCNTSYKICCTRTRSCDNNTRFA